MKTYHVSSIKVTFNTTKSIYSLSVTAGVTSGNCTQDNTHHSGSYIERNVRHIPNLSLPRHFSLLILINQYNFHCSLVRLILYMFTGRKIGTLKSFATSQNSELHRVCQELDTNLTGLYSFHAPFLLRNMYHSVHGIVSRPT